MPEEAKTPEYAPLEEDGHKVVQERRRKRNFLYLSLLVGYFFGGCIVYWMLEGWNPLQSLLFCLSITTGVGYGHLAPTSQISMLVTAGYVILGLAVFATIAGQVLDFVVQAEIDAVSDLIEGATDPVQTGGNKYDAARNKQHHDSYHAKQVAARRFQFLVGLANMIGIYTIAVIWFILQYELSFCEANYYASLSVMKLDSLCTIEGIHCAADSHDSRAGEAKDLILAIVWCIITYGTIGHFCVSACSYLGADPEPVMTKINHMTKARWQRMDADGDGMVRRADFLRDRLIRGGVCEAEQIDHILANFDALDKDHSGVINSKTVQWE